MKLKDGFITRNLADEQIMVSSTGDFGGLVRSNKTAAFIVDCLGSDITEDEIVCKMREKYDAPEEILREDVKKIITTLRSIGALDE